MKKAPFTKAPPPVIPELVYLPVEQRDFGYSRIYSVLDEATEAMADLDEMAHECDRAARAAQEAARVYADVSIRTQRRCRAIEHRLVELQRLARDEMAATVQRMLAYNDRKFKRETKEKAS